MPRLIKHSCCSSQSYHMWRDSNGAGLPGRLYGGQYQRIEPRRARLTIASNMIAPASETRNVMAVSGALLMSPRERVRPPRNRSEDDTSELQSLIHTSYAVI